MLFSSRIEERVGVRLLVPFPCTLEVFIRIQLSESHTKKTERKLTEFPKTASQNADHVPSSDPSFLIHSLYPGPSLRLPFIDVAAWGPVIERSCSKWTTNPFDWIACKCIILFSLFTAKFLSSLYLLIVSYLLRYLFSSVPTPILYFASSLKPTPMSLILNIAFLLYPWSAAYLYLLWCQAADSSSGVGLLRPFPSSRACTERRTFIDSHMRWSEQGLLWGIDSGDHSHYSTSWAQCLRAWLNSSLSRVLGVLIFV